ncbi:Ltp family lipoprotein [Dellaglioa sp. L3N]
MKKVLLVTSLLLSMLIFTACGSTTSNSSTKNTKVDNRKVYTTKITSITENEYHDWEVEGTTNAPDGSKILSSVADDKNMNYGFNASASLSDMTSFPKVENGKFSASIDPISLIDSDNEKTGQKINALIFVVTNYTTKWTSVTIPSKIMSMASSKIDPTILTVTSSQVKYYNSLDSDDSDSNEDSSNSSTNKSKGESSKVGSESKKEAHSAKASVPAEYKSALNSADYFANTDNMSKAGLYEQLTSDAGEKFSAEAAQYAVDNVDADWDANALVSAKYFQDDMSMSPEAIREQLTADAGEKFSAEQANYAIDHLTK